MGPVWYCAVVTGCLLVVGAPARADDDLQAAARERGIVVQVTKKTFLVVVPVPGTDPKNFLLQSAVYYGDGKTFYRQELSAYQPPDKKHGAILSLDDDWRFLRTTRDLESADGVSWQMTCDSRTKKLALAPESVARGVLEHAVFQQTLPGNTPELFGRSGTTYYLIDHPRTPEDNSDFQLFIGKRGAMKQIKIKEISSDSAGTVLVTASGTLQILPGNPRTASFGRDLDHLSPLTLMKLSANSKLIYGDLGVYRHEKSGLVCDDL